MNDSLPDPAPTPAPDQPGPAGRAAVDLHICGASTCTSSSVVHRRHRRCWGGSSIYEGLNKLLWENDFVTRTAWMFPVICLPFSLLVGLLVKYRTRRATLDESILDSMSGDVTQATEWTDTSAQQS